MYLNSIYITLAHFHLSFLLWFLGILALGGLDLSYVTINIQDMTYKGQSSHHVSVLDDGSFSVSSDWILETPGELELSKSTSAKPHC